MAALRLALAGMLRLAAAQRHDIPGLEAHLQPPRHDSLAHFEFLEVLHIDRPSDTANRGHPAGPSAPRERSRRHWSLWFPGIGTVELQALQEVAERAITYYWPNHPALWNLKEPEVLGLGSFGVTYLAKKMSSNEKVAVKLLMSGQKDDQGNGAWCNSKLYHENSQLRALVDQSRDECVNIQKIHKGAEQDAEGANHVVGCLYDGITPKLADPAGEDPFFIELTFDGRDTLDARWVKLMKATNLKKEDYIRSFKNFTKDMFVGLRFLAESGKDAQWVHHDLKAQNMVVDESGKLTIVDMGTAMSSSQSNSTAACTAFSRPPEVCPFLWLQNAVGFDQPIWSFDVFSAAAVVLGMAGDILTNAKVISDVGVLPYYTYYMSEIIQHSMIRLDLLTQAIHCAMKEPLPNGAEGNKKAEAFAEAFYNCAADLSSAEFKILNSRRLNAIRGSKGEVRKAALASLLNCRSSGIAVTTHIYRPTHNLGEPTPSKFFWTLLDDWMASGFDEILLKALSSDPSDRPKPSEIIESNWFKNQEINGEGKEVEFSCPEYGWDDTTRVGLMIGLLVLITLLSCCACCGGGFLSFTAGVEVWKWMLPLAGVLVIAVPVMDFYVVSWRYVWLITMVPVGLIMVTLGCSLVPALKEKMQLDKRWYLSCVTVALLLVVMIALDHTLTLSPLSYTAGQLRQAKEVERVDGASEKLEAIADSLRVFMFFNFLSGVAVLMTLGSLVMDVDYGKPTGMPGTSDVEMQAREVGTSTAAPANT